MAIKNYTTTIDVFVSLGEIQESLASHGARKIMVDYNQAGKPEKIIFAIATCQGLCGYRLPANVEGVKAVFAKQKVRDISGQAERTAWRNVRDWVMAQMAMVEAGNAEIQEVFMPYLTNNRGETLYQLYQSGSLSLTDGGGENNGTVL